MADHEKQVGNSSIIKASTIRMVESSLESRIKAAISKGEPFDFDVTVLVPVHKELMSNGYSNHEAIEAIETTVCVWIKNSWYTREDENRKGLIPKGRLTASGIEHFQQLP